MLGVSRQWTMDMYDQSSIARGLAAAGIAGLVLFGPWAEAYSCDCGKPTSVPDAARSATAVFQGRVVALTLGSRWVSAAATKPGVCGTLIKFEGYDSALCQDENVIVKFQVLRAWKGISAREVTVATSMYVTACGYRFTVGRDYLVYAVLTNGRLETDRCTRTAELPAPANDMETLGPPARDFLLEHDRELHEAASGSRREAVP